MYLHLGADTVVRQSEIIGIFDLDTTTVSKHSRDFLGSAQKRGGIVSLGEDLPKSFIVTRARSGQLVYLSPLSAATLAKRAIAFSK
ncbi:MAG: DUF370 domain-containing protein [Oscillospiraceae bacterium]|nr:DUF370 domain-containing protein [Oscillospiraceae bacterium]